MALPKEVVNVESKYFTACKDCSPAEEHGKDEITRVLSPSLDNPNPPSVLNATALVNCRQLPPQGNVVGVDTDIELDGKLSSQSSGAIKCPALGIE